MKWMWLYARISIDSYGQFAGNQRRLQKWQNMMKGGEVHHTKSKGDIGLAKVIADLMLKGYTPCIPLSEHQPYDLVAVGKGGKVFKLQVKYASLKPNGTVEIRFRSSWADKNGSHIRHYRKEEFDLYAIYCPEKEAVLYIPNSSTCPKAVRFDITMNNQKRNVKWAKEYLCLS
jgi:hypothetical protein